MKKNTNEVDTNDMFVDNLSNEVTDKIKENDDFYEDEIIDNEKEIELNDSNENINRDDEPISDLNFDNKTLNIPTEVPLEENKEDEPFDFHPISQEPLEIEDAKDVSNEMNEDTNSFSMPNLSTEELDKMIDDDKEKEQLDDSYVLSNFDVLFDSLYNDVNGANNFISDLIEQKKNVNINEASLNEQVQKLEKEKEEFEKFMKKEKEGIELEKKQCKEFVRKEKNRIQNEETQFNADMEALKAEIKLSEESLKIEEEKLNDERQQFEKYKEIEEQKINTEKEKLEALKQQFEKEQEIEQEKLKNAQKELQAQKEQFAKTKDLEEKKLELESKNLSQSCARFKELVSQFNSGFQQLPDDK